ncbi:SPOR domain-containing protein [Sphingomonas lutea]|uniref:SPOR domain-containing protein n=1 Tax=Sphingomonas lutea TaxID=1045317 RepID=A0A7G9SHI5_9SPHN|nr:SPOR domain-containing protein [Sphingomonas lutea]QNN67310.1 SPOR domain-containing protein [Sphingomonas lutea]
MTDSRAAVGMDRLPWLHDEPKPRAGHRAREVLGWAVAGALLLAGGSYWLGTRSVDRPQADPVVQPAPAPPQASVKLPEARLPAPPPPVEIVETPEVRPAPAPVVSVPEPRAARPSPPRRRAILRREEPPRARLDETVSEQKATVATPAPARPAPTQSARAAPARAKQLTLWNARQSAGASGRLVQIGAFGSRQQAKLGWRRMQRSYPAVARLPAVVVPTRNSRGKRFYRFQIGTTSQAHSEVLCQRMRRIRYSCAVVGLPWKAKVER